MVWHELFLDIFFCVGRYHLVRSVYKKNDLNNMNKDKSNRNIRSPLDRLVYHTKVGNFGTNNYEADADRSFHGSFLLD